MFVTMRLCKEAACRCPGVRVFWKPEPHRLFVSHVAGEVNTTRHELKYVNLWLRLSRRPLALCAVMLNPDQSGKHLRGKQNS